MAPGIEQKIKHSEVFKSVDFNGFTIDFIVQSSHQYLRFGGPVK